MQHILDPNEKGIHFGRYLEALRAYRDRLPSHVAEFAGDEERFTLSHPKSLHDAWLECVCVRESRSTEETASAVGVELVLLGQRHDRRIRISYEGVTRYRLQGWPDDGSSVEAFHGDIFTHEVRVTEEGRIVHEIAFVTGSVFFIECADFRVFDEFI